MFFLRGKGVVAGHSKFCSFVRGTRVIMTFYDRKAKKITKYFKNGNFSGKF